MGVTTWYCKDGAPGRQCCKGVLAKATTTQTTTIAGTSCSCARPDFHSCDADAGFEDDGACDGGEQCCRGTTNFLTQDGLCKREFDGSGGCADPTKYTCDATGGFKGEYFMDSNGRFVCAGAEQCCPIKPRKRCSCGLSKGVCEDQKLPGCTTRLVYAESCLSRAEPKPETSGVTGFCCCDQALAPMSTSATPTTVTTAKPDAPSTYPTSTACSGACINTDTHACSNGRDTVRGLCPGASHVRCCTAGNGTPKTTTAQSTTSQCKDRYSNVAMCGDDTSFDCMGGNFVELYHEGHPIFGATRRLCGSGLKCCITGQLQAKSLCKTEYGEAAACGDPSTHRCDGSSFYDLLLRRSLCKGVNQCCPTGKLVPKTTTPPPPPQASPTPPTPQQGKCKALHGDTAICASTTDYLCKNPSWHSTYNIGPPIGGATAALCPSGKACCAGTLINLDHCRRLHRAGKCADKNKYVHSLPTLLSTHGVPRTLEAP